MNTPSEVGSYRAEMAPLAFWKRDGITSRVAMVLSSPDADGVLTVVSTAERVYGRVSHVTVEEVSLRAFVTRHKQPATVDDAAATVDLRDRWERRQYRPLNKPSARAIAVFDEICDHVVDRGRSHQSLTDTGQLASALGLTRSQIAPTLSMLVKFDLVAIGETVGDHVQLFPTIRGGVLYHRLQAQV